MNNFENNINTLSNLDGLSRSVIAYFGANNEFEENLAGNNSPECKLFNLALQYLDENMNSEREDIGRKLEKLVMDYKNCLL